MAAFLGDLLQCIDNQVYLGQQILNVYYYRVVSISELAGDYLSAINDQFELNVLSAVRDLQNSGVQHVSREWKNLTNEVDLFVNGEVLAGTSGSTESTGEPSFVSAGFILRRESLATRNGYKRFAGLTEGQVSGNTYTGDAGVITAIEVALAEDLFLGVIDTVEPVIVKRPIPSPATSFVYASIGSSSFRGIGTQNTRKAGRGI